MGKKKMSQADEAEEIIKELFEDKTEIPEEPEEQIAEESAGEPAEVTEEPAEDAQEPAGEKQPEEKAGHGKKHREKPDPKDQTIIGLTDRYNRLIAEFDNFRKRTEREKVAMFDNGVRALAESLLPSLDALEQGLKASSGADESIVAGMEKIYKQLLGALESKGVVQIEAVGQPFDPNLHNAVMHVEDDSVGENMVVEEFQKGYQLNSVVIRPSMVKVAN